MSTNQPVPFDTREHTADETPIEGSVIEYELTFTEGIWVKRFYDEFSPDELKSWRYVIQQPATMPGEWHTLAECKPVNGAVCVAEVMTVHGSLVEYAVFFQNGKCRTTKNGDNLADSGIIRWRYAVAPVMQPEPKPGEKRIPMWVITKKSGEVMYVDTVPPGPQHTRKDRIWYVGEWVGVPMAEPEAPEFDVDRLDYLATYATPQGKKTLVEAKTTIERLRAELAAAKGGAK